MREDYVEWMKSRRGLLTASRISPILDTPRKKGEVFTDKAKTLMWDLLTENLYNDDFEENQIESPAIAWGQAKEKEAIAKIAEIFKFDQVDVDVKLKRDEISRFIGATPDGLAYDDVLYSKPTTLIEVKCPYNMTNHVKRIKRIEKEYIVQVQCQLMVFQLKKAIFASYHPYCKTPLVLRIIEEDKEMHEQLRDRASLLFEQFSKEPFSSILEQFSEEPFSSIVEKFKKQEKFIELIVADRPD